MNAAKRKERNIFTHRSRPIIAFIALSFIVFGGIPELRSQPLIKITPDTINFGSLHVGKVKTDSFTISNSGVSFFLDTNVSASLLGSNFSNERYLKANPILQNEITDEVVHYRPQVRKVDTLTLFIKSISIAANKSPHPKVFLIGRGIDYLITDTSYNFGKIRIGKSSDTITIAVANIGDDTTTITSISFDPGRNPGDFGLVQNTLPPKPQGWFLDTPDTLKGNIKFFKAYFLPVYDSAHNIIDTGFRTAIVKIQTADGNIIYDTLTGTGVEPWITASPQVLDFGTITNPLLGSSADTTLYDTIYNHGTMSGILNSLRNDSLTYFTVHPITTPVSLLENSSLPIAVDFHILQIGDFTDTIFIGNDSRNKPLIVLKAKVRAGIAPVQSVFLDTIANCLPVDTTIFIRNPYRVTVTVGSIHFTGDTGGFELLDTDRTYLQINNGDTLTLNFPVHLGPGISFPFHIGYRFPADSLNGPQTVKIVFSRPTGASDGSLSYDTALVSLVRKTELLKLSSVLPPFNPSAGDAPFRLPIHLGGNRFGKAALDNDTLKLIFSDQLIQPVGVDRSGSLTESTAANGVPPQPIPTWDSATSTYTIPLVGLHVSSDVTKNTLLLTVLCSAYLTKDTSLTIVAQYTNPECAYHITKDSTVISYANECGDKTIRNILLSGNIPVRIVSLSPDPVTSDHQNVICAYFAAKEVIISWKVFDARGIIVARGASGDACATGAGSFAIPMKQTGSSGAHYLEVTATDPITGAHSVVSSKFMIMK